MNLYFFVALIPILMFLDYFLTIFQQKTYRLVYGKHIVVDDFELNPLFQKEVKKERWFSKKHLIITASATAYFGALVFFARRMNVEDALHEFFLLIFGVILTQFCLINSTHIANILTFRYVNRNPNQLTGQVHMGYLLSLHNSMYRYLSFALPLAFMAFVRPTAFTIGCLIAPLSLTITHLIWIKKAKKTKQSGAA